MINADMIHYRHGRVIVCGVSIHRAGFWADTWEIVTCPICLEKR